MRESATGPPIVIQINTLVDLKSCAVARGPEDPYGRASSNSDANGSTRSGHAWVVEPSGKKIMSRG
jgi:hypothetical protein